MIIEFRNIKDNPRFKPVISVTAPKAFSPYKDKMPKTAPAEMPRHKNGREIDYENSWRLR